MATYKEIISEFDADANVAILKNNKKYVDKKPEIIKEWKEVSK